MSTNFHAFTLFSRETDTESFKIKKLKILKLSVFSIFLYLTHLYHNVFHPFGNHFNAPDCGQIGP
jgi:hypothetical protein